MHGPETREVDPIKIKLNELIELGINNEKKRMQYAHDIVKLLWPRLKEKYWKHEGQEMNYIIDIRLSDQLYAILESLDDHDPRLKSIIDLGCGSTGGTVENRSMDKEKKFEPWLPRLLYEIEANPVGIDVGNLEGEPFRHYQQDLIKDNALEMLGDNSADLVVTTAFYDSPELYDRGSGQEIREKLIPQIKRILKDEGKFVEMDTGMFNAQPKQAL